MINRDDLEAEIMARAVNSAEVKQGLKEFGEAVVAYWRSVSPVRTGKYAASVHVIKRFKADGIPGVKVGSSSHRAALIEYGTGADDKGKDPRYVPALGVQVGRDTPTPAFAPRAKTAAHFGGDEKHIDRVNDLVQEQNESIASGDSKFDRASFIAELRNR